MNPSISQNVLCERELDQPLAPILKKAPLVLWPLRRAGFAMLVLWLAECPAWHTGAACERHDGSGATQGVKTG